MGGRPKVHASGNEFELGYYRLNLSVDQLGEVAKKLALAIDSDFAKALGTGGGVLQPDDGQEVMITYKGRYVRVTYQLGQPVKITPLG